MSLLDEQDRYEQAAANLFGRNDLLLKLSMITHIRKTIDNLEREMHRQWQMAEDIYRQMEQDGLEEKLGDYNTPTHLRSTSLLSDSDKPLPLYRWTPSPNPSARHRWPMPSITIVFLEYSPPSPIPPPPQQSRRPTPFHPIGTHEHPILVKEDDDDTMFCNICHNWGHEWIDCQEYQCEHCQVYGPGHTSVDCFYRWSWDLQPSRGVMLQFFFLHASASCLTELLPYAIPHFFLTSLHAWSSLLIHCLLTIYMQLPCVILMVTMSLSSI